MIANLEENFLVVQKNHSNPKLSQIILHIAELVAALSGVTVAKPVSEVTVARPLQVLWSLHGTNDCISPVLAESLLEEEMLNLARAIVNEMTPEEVTGFCGISGEIVIASKTFEPQIAFMVHADNIKNVIKCGDRLDIKAGTRATVDMSFNTKRIFIKNPLWDDTDASTHYEVEVGMGGELEVVFSENRPVMVLGFRR